MVYPRIQICGLPPDEIAAVSVAFEEVCRLLHLSPREDALRDVVADVAIDCAKRGRLDPQEILLCAKEALRQSGGC
jgi:hypothetical protein